MQDNLSKAAKKLSLAPEHIHITVMPTAEPAVVTLVVRAADPSVVGSMDLTMTRTDIGSILGMPSLTISQAAVDTGNADATVAAVLKKYGLPINARDLRVVNINTNPLIIKAIPQSPDWYGQLTIFIQE